MRRSRMVIVGLLVLSGGMGVRADEPSNEALKAEIRVLKERLAAVESRLDGSGLGGGDVSIGDKPAASGALELPSGLAGVQLSGYVDFAYAYALNEPDSRLTTARVFDTEANGFTPHAAEVVLEKPVSDEMPIGFRTDLFFGDDAELIHSTGLGIGSDIFDLQQAYVNASTPFGVDLKAGKFVTLLGAEVIESPANWNYSRSYLFGYAIPFTHTGVLATYPLAEMGSVSLGVVNGWDIVDENNKAKSILGNVTVSPMDGVTLAVNGITGAERTSDSRNKRSVVDVVASWQATEELALMANFDYGHESGLTQGVFVTPGDEGATWHGLALYGKYDLSPTWSLASRWEYFSDQDNVRLGLTGPGGGAISDVDYQELTLTSAWKLYEHVITRLEYRHDWADEDVFARDGGSTGYQDSVAAEVIYHF